MTGVGDNVELLVLEDVARFARPSRSASRGLPGALRASVVIPAYDEAARIERSLRRLVTDPWWDEDVELLVVDDGSRDDTAAIARSVLHDIAPAARVLQLPWHAGKGAAVRLGVAAAHGRDLVFMDADLATDLAALPDAIAALAHADVVVGSRRHPAAVVTGRSPARELLHRGFTSHARRVAGIESTDPQCGFKAFRHDVAKLLFHLSKLDGFGFDVEILLLARKLGLRLAEVPVSWHAVEGSKVRPVRDTVSMFTEVGRARLAHARRTPLAALAAE